MPVAQALFFVPPNHCLPRPNQASVRREMTNPGLFIHDLDLVPLTRSWHPKLFFYPKAMSGLV